MQSANSVVELVTKRARIRVRSTEGTVGAGAPLSFCVGYNLVDEVAPRGVPLIAGYRGGHGIKGKEEGRDRMRRDTVSRTKAQGIC